MLIHGLTIPEYLISLLDLQDELTNEEFMGCQMWIQGRSSKVEQLKVDVKDLQHTLVCMEELLEDILPTKPLSQTPTE